MSYYLILMNLLTQFNITHYAPVILIKELGINCRTGNLKNKFLLKKTAKN